MKPPIDGGVVLITGASSGIGRELARLLAKRAGVLILVARRAERLEALKKELVEGLPDLDVQVMPCDLTDLRDIDRILAELETRGQSVDVLVNNAGVGDYAAFDLSDWKKIEFMTALNVTAPLYITHKLIGKMVERGRGGILNVGSSYGLTFAPGFAAYIGSKHFFNGFTESLRLDMAGVGVVVTQACPGPVRTEFLEHLGGFERPMIPPLVAITGQQCAKEILKAFDRSQALVIPGTIMKLVMLAEKLTPKVILRLVNKPMAIAMRRKQISAGKGGEA